jgi:hypothetical protein
VRTKASRIASALVLLRACRRTFRFRKNPPPPACPCRIPSITSVRSLSRIPAAPVAKRTPSTSGRAGNDVGASGERRPCDGVPFRLSAFRPAEARKPAAASRFVDQATLINSPPYRPLTFGPNSRARLCPSKCPPKAYPHIRPPAPCRRRKVGTSSVSRFVLRNRHLPSAVAWAWLITWFAALPTKELEMNGS